MEVIWTDIKFKLGGYTCKKIQSLKSSIEKYWIGCTTHLSNIIGDSMKKIDA